MALVGVTGSHESSLESAALCTASQSPPIKLALQCNTSKFLGEIVESVELRQFSKPKLGVKVNSSFLPSCHSTQCSTFLEIMQEVQVKLAPFPVVGIELLELLNQWSY